MGDEGRGPGSEGGRRLSAVEWFRGHRGAAAVAAGVVAAFVLGYLVGRVGRAPEKSGGHAKSEQAAEEKPLFYYCSMRPQIRQPAPGKCPICAMDLIPAHEGGAGEELGPRELKLSEAAQSLAEIRTSPVERRFVTAEVRMVGKIEYDETRLKHITAWVGGRLDRLYADYTGITVKKGDHMVLLYSPEILAAQEELLQAIKAARELRRSGSESVRRAALATVEAAREKLRLWGLTPEQVADIELRRKPSDHITIHAPIGGIVVHKHVAEGMYVKTGTRIYAIADLTQLWVKLDAYESDLPFVKLRQEVEFTTESSPGEVFKGVVAFIDPVLDAKTRTVKVRVNVPNRSGKLKPGMFVRATLRAKVAKGGRVMGPDLSGKWICPMHLEIIKDAADKCDLCGMPLEPAENLGYVPAGEPEPPLVIPATAPLITGKRAVVYVAVPDKKGVFEGREIILGPRAGDYYIVNEGLREGELVVTNGAFKIDADLQIKAKPSMMSPGGGRPAAAPAGAAKAQTTCPVMGGKINRKLHADHDGKRVYFCCPGCFEPFKKDPAKYIKKLEDQGVIVEKAPATGGK